jgi:hypothetical protein
LLFELACATIGSSKLLLPIELINVGTCISHDDEHVPHFRGNALYGVSAHIRHEDGCVRHHDSIPLSHDDARVLLLRANVREYLGGNVPSLRDEDDDVSHLLDNHNDACLSHGTWLPPPSSSGVGDAIYLPIREPNRFSLGSLKKGGKKPPSRTINQC